jgi:hypothetical protein
MLHSDSNLNNSGTIVWRRGSLGASKEDESDCIVEDEVCVGGWWSCVVILRASVWRVDVDD